jgi:hypothetical protein
MNIPKGYKPTLKSINGIEYTVGQIYRPPPEKVCDFLKKTFHKTDRSARNEQRELANKLIKLCPQKADQIVSVREILDSFPWMYQVGILMYDWGYWPKGGIQVRCMLYRCADASEINAALTARPTILDGRVFVEPGALSSEKKEKKKKKCCDSPKIVRSKKTGKKFCKNCGKIKKKKKKNSDV